MIDELGRRLRFLPLHSPDFDPTEPAWCKLKRLRRGAAARTRQMLKPAFQNHLDQFTASDAHG